MKVRYIPATVTLTAGAITSIACIIKKYEVLYSLELLLVVLIIFTIIGLTAQKIVLGVIKENKIQEEERIQEERLRQIEAEYGIHEEEEQEDIEAEEVAEDEKIV